ncbi:hypothetical protein LNV23_14630 [Paucibacter sp. DJ1R-11]|uniref:hypothetical protein n=1 Tax=Paucibacter sp. DJ1R-11 TaxID=2893556 RepID=UPI0021E3620A|nr:hypothetical protein [Paucibacter sp. DJ1R-11]MCV2364686.1 hypothetical protein [Paucibacter sp. DJ1R-11]
MSLLAMMEGRRVLALLLLAVLLGWYAVPAEVPAPGLVQPRRDVWELPELLVPATPGSQSLLVSSAAFWGPEPKPLSESAAPVANTRWRLAGVYGAGKQGGVLVLFADESKPALRLAVGDKLPSGHVIDAVDGNQICIWIGKKRYRMGVERRE